ncbi:Uncharacterised protein [Vibrio cholerae]|nr:Uncharacterised protein [Vibrio cholerae]
MNHRCDLAFFVRTLNVLAANFTAFGVGRVFA